MNVAFIPVRGGSKSIPLKNIKLIGGKPLVYWAVKAACGCKYINKVYVTTDSEKIKETVENFKSGIEADLFEKVEVIGRSEESASDTASTEFVMLEFANNYDFNNIVLIQATSPLLQSKDLDSGFETFLTEGTDSVISVVRQKRFHWENDEKGYAHPTNYDVYHRPRRQEFKGFLVENGAFYISSKEALIKSKNRISGNIKAVEMNEDTFWEIDEPSDWVVIEALMEKNGTIARSEMPEIKMLLTDCDGCLTDGGMYYAESGDELKKFNTRDGMGFRMLKKKGILTGIVTGENVKLNRRRAEKLELDILKAGVTDKLSVVKELCVQYGLTMRDIVYIGDDINDLEVIKAAGMGCCPADAVEEVKKVADYVAIQKGGRGVIREVAEMIIERCRRS